MADMIVEQREGFCDAVLAVGIRDSTLRIQRAATLYDIANAFVRSPHLMTELEVIFQRKMEERYGEGGEG